jgi:ATP-dependent DNA ligase
LTECHTPAKAANRWCQRPVLEPALATSISKVPGGDRWVHEIKFDGYRVQVHLREAAMKVLTTRNGSQYA